MTSRQREKEVIAALRSPDAMNPIAATLAVPRVGVIA